MDIDLCPPWWPWPFPPRRDRFLDIENLVIPEDARITVNMFRALTIYNMAFQLEDKGAAREMQRLAATQLAEMGQRLQEHGG